MLKDASTPVPALLRRSSPDPDALVAVPAFNEEPTIGSVVLKAREFAREVIVVDDGSTDRTAEVAQLAGAKVIQHDSNRGYGSALRSIFNYARESSADLLVILDGDGQHDPTAIPDVVRPVQQGMADMSIGSRFLNGQTSSRVPRFRHFGIGVLTRLTNRGSRKGAKVRDAQSGFRAYSRKAIEMLDPRDTDMGASTEIIWDANKHGLRIVEVPIDVTYDGNGSTKGALRHGLSVIGSMLVYVETKHALLAFGVPGLAILGSGFAVGLFVAQGYYSTRELAIGLALVTLMLVILGTLLLFSGIILHAVINANKRSR